MKRQALELRAQLFRGLGDLSRLRVLEALRDGPLTAGDVAVRARLSQSNASMHLACLAECGLVRWERDGKFMNYEIADKRVVKLLDHAEDLLLQVGPLIEACRRYQRPALQRTGAGPREKRRWRR
jgi:DNA-binding transcriptional ArsR family regulator